MARPATWSAEGVVGRTYGRLTIRCVSAQGGHCLCTCSCGTSTATNIIAVLRGKTQSCGCYHRERTSETRRLEATWESAFNTRVGSVKYAAEKRGYAFDLTRDECYALMTSNCHWCGEAPKKVKTRGYSKFACNGIDRVDNAVGYHTHNAVACCTACNKAKLDRSPAEFLTWARRLVAHQEAC